MHAFQVVWTIARKDIRIWLRHPLMLISSLLVPLTYFLVVWLGSQAVGHNPVAVVNEDRGPEGSKIVQAIRQADVFRLYVVPADRAQGLYSSLQVAAILTIPQNFSQRVDAKAPVALQVYLNNYNLDLAGDIRRAVPDAVTTYYQMQGDRSPMKVTIAEQPLRPQDITLFEYSVLPLVILIVTVTGIIFSGMAATNEWEQKTIKELLLAPFAAFLIILGKVFAGFICTFILAASMLALGALLGLYQITGIYWLSTLAVVALASAMSSGVGVAIGATFQRKQPVSYAATLAAVWAFAGAGGVGVIFFEPEWLQSIAQFDPLTYAIHALQEGIFYQSTALLGRDLAVLAVTACIALFFGSLSMRRGILER
jgi:ABC-2 type transport system permease protein